MDEKSKPGDTPAGALPSDNPPAPKDSNVTEPSANVSSRAPEIKPITPNLKADASPPPVVKPSPTTPPADTKAGELPTFEMMPDDLKKPAETTPPVSELPKKPVNTPSPGSTQGYTPPPAPTITSFSEMTSGGLKLARAYLVEYFMSLLITGTLIGVAISFFNSIVSSIGANSSGSGWVAKFAYTSSLATLSTALVFIAVLVFVSRRCRALEEESPEIKANRWRKGFLGFFLILVAIAALSATVALVYGLVSLIASIGVTSVHIGDTIKGLSVTGFSVIILASTFMLYSQDYRSGNMNQLFAKFHRYGLVILVLFLTLLFIFMPLKQQRNSFVDGIKARDITALHYQVDRYVTKNNKLPEALDNVELKDFEGNLSNYEYKPGDSSYELCADFKTDTQRTTDNSNPLEAALYGSSFSSSSSYVDPNFHDSGNQCFKYDARLYSNLNNYPTLNSQYDYLR